MKKVANIKNRNKKSLPNKLVKLFPFQSACTLYPIPNFGSHAQLLDIFGRSCFGVSLAGLEGVKEQKALRYIWISNYKQYILLHLTKKLPWRKPVALLALNSHPKVHRNQMRIAST